MSQGKPSGIKLIFKLGTANSGLKGCQSTATVQIRQTIETFKRQAEHRPTGFRHFEVAHHAGSTAVGDNNGIIVDGKFQQLLNLRRRGRQRHTIRKSPQLSTA